MQFTLPDDQEVPFVAPTTGVDLRGNPTTLKGNVKITVSDDKILKIVQPDPATPAVAASGVLQCVGPLGNAQVKFEDDDEGGSPLITLVDVTVVGGATVGLADPTFGAIRPATPATPTPAPAS